MKNLIPTNYVSPKDDGLKMECPWWTPESIFFLMNVLTGKELVLDCGMGGSTLFFARRCAHVTGIETNNEWLNKVNSVATERGLNSKIRGVYCETLANAEEFIKSLPNNHFDIISMDIQGNGRQRWNLLSYAFEKLKPKGIIIQDNYSNSDDYLKKKSITKMFSCDFPHEIHNFDDPKWKGSGTRIIRYL